MAQVKAATSKGLMEIVRERSFITHNSKDQQSITIEYTIKSNKDKLKNIFLIFNEFLPSLVIKDQHNSILSLIPSRNLHKLCRIMMKKVNEKEKKLLEKKLVKIRSNKEHVIWFSLLAPMGKSEIRTFTLTYIPESHLKDKPYMKIKIKKKYYPVYYSLFSPKNFDFVDVKYIYKKDNITKKESQPPPFVKVFSGSQTLSLRITAKSSPYFILTYRLKVQRLAKFSTLVGTLLLTGLSVVFLALKVFDSLVNVQDILDKNIEIGLFVMGASLILPRLQSDDEVRRRLVLYYLIPFAFGLAVLLSKITY